jgi:hypothetical protein
MRSRLRRRYTLPTISKRERTSRAIAKDVPEFKPYRPRQHRRTIGPIRDMWLADLIKDYVEKGNFDAARKVVTLIIKLLRRREPLPSSLADWLADRLDECKASPAKTAGQVFRVAPIPPRRTRSARTRS